MKLLTIRRCGDVTHVSEPDEVADDHYVFGVRLILHLEDAYLNPLDNLLPNVSIIKVMFPSCDHRRPDVVVSEGRDVVMMDLKEKAIRQIVTPCGSSEHPRNFLDRPPPPPPPPPQPPQDPPPHPPSSPGGGGQEATGSTLANITGASSSSGITQSETFIRIQQYHDWRESTLRAHQEKELQQFRLQVLNEAKKKQLSLRKQHEIQLKALKVQREDDYKRLQGELDLQMSKARHGYEAGTLNDEKITKRRKTRSSDMFEGPKD